jgi:hypothetical protein
MTKMVKMAKKNATKNEEEKEIEEGGSLRR